MQPLLAFRFCFGLMTAVAAASDDVVVRQAWCGRYALALAAGYHGLEISSGRLNELLPDDHSFVSLADLEAAARALGYETLLVHWTDRMDANLRCPCILQVKVGESSAEADHFVTCFGSDSSAALLGDFPKAPIWVSRDRLAVFWSGATLYVARQGDRQLEGLRWQLRLITIRKLILAATGVVCIAIAWLSLRPRPRPHADAQT